MVFLLTFALCACGSVPPQESAGTGAVRGESGAAASGEDAEQGESGAAASGEDAEQGESAAATSEEDVSEESSFDEPADTGEENLPEDGTYTTKEDVALYIYLYGKLPGNFITKKEAQKLGWEGGSLEPYAPGKCIGGSRFGNYEGLLPEADGRVYTECDIDTLGQKKRGAKRIVFSNDGLIYYTEDHYESFELLYGEE
ncbi:MAG: ribonuclease [Lachnospiraceae bacterium]|nr:ribonuclease [Lachnospiraceae bacterium]